MRLDRKVLVGHVHSSVEKIVLTKVLDLVETLLKNHSPQLTHFHDPYHTGLILSLLERIPELDFATYGGYTTAERTRTAIFPAYLTGTDIDYEITLLAVEGNFKMVQVNHRDFLGSLLGLGIRREMVGDLIVTPKGCQVMVTREIASYLMINLTKVHKVRVEVREIDPGELVLPELKVKEIKTTVASLRLDAVAAAGFATSRSRMAREIQAERLNLNWHTCSNVAAPIQKGDMLSLRGRGRVEVSEIKGNTKSGRIGIVLKRYL